jgi:Ni,Fe-hydrogenase I cytochrome b subunit
MGTAMAKHEHGSTDTADHEKTFAGFLRVATWVAAVSISILIFLALVNA